MINLTVYENYINLIDVKIICDKFRYPTVNKKIPGSTWRKYKNTCGVKPFATFTDEKTAIKLMIVCTHKFVHPKSPINSEGIEEYLETHPELIELFRAKFELLGKIQGKNLTNLINAKTGYSVSEKTLYRWSKKSGYLIYERNKLYTENELNEWCNYAESMKDKVNLVA